MELISPLITLIVLLIFVVPIFLRLVVIVDQYERAIVLTLGKYSYTLQPGLQLVVPFVQRVIKVDIRVKTQDIPQQEVITKDNVPIGINAVSYTHLDVYKRQT